MKKIFVFGFLAAAALGFGCAITNYDLITDNDGSSAVNTNGKAYILTGIQVATLWPDGADMLFSMVDQKANGDRVLTTYNYASDGVNDVFKDNLYCTPNWNGCAIATAQDPQTNDVDWFDYSANANCSGYRSLSLLVSTDRYYGECGRAAVTDRTMKMLGLANEMTPVQYQGSTWLRTNLNALNTSIVLNNNNGSVFAVPMTSQIGVMANFAKRQMVVDMTNPNNRNLIQSAINWNNAHPGPSINATLTVNGQAFPFNVKPTLNMNRVPNDRY